MPFPLANCDQIMLPKKSLDYKHTSATHFLMGQCQSGQLLSCPYICFCKSLQTCHTNWDSHKFEKVKGVRCCRIISSILKKPSAWSLMTFMSPQWVCIFFYRQQSRFVDDTAFCCSFFYEESKTSQNSTFAITKWHFMSPFSCSFTAICYCQKGHFFQGC